MDAVPLGLVSVTACSEAVGFDYGYRSKPDRCLLLIMPLIAVSGGQLMSEAKHTIHLTIPQIESQNIILLLETLNYFSVQFMQDHDPIP